MQILEKLRRRSGSKMTMNVCMMGPRAVGKTSVLTAIFSETQESIATTKLLLHAMGDTNADIIAKKQMLTHIFAKRIAVEDRPEAGIDASSTVRTFDFSFGLKGKEPKVDLHIKDFPGEYVISKPEEVISYIEESNAVFIAIDSPHLLEEDGRYCNAKNRVSDITDFFRQCLGRLSSDKLVLLIPLKCEKYFYEKKMDQLLSRVEEAYADLLDMFKDNDMIVCAVTPILTLGGVVFGEFAGNEDGALLTRDGCPADVVYRFREKDASYSPAFCVQPLYYLLSFVAAQYKRSKENRSFIDRMISKMFDFFDNDPELFEEILKIERFRGIDIPGYKVECGKDKFQYNR